jgi:mannobiose 2-epimerase
MNLYQHFGDQEALEHALRCYDYIQNYLVDHKDGEWYWSCDIEGKPNQKDDKAGFWKCPYHNGRMCLELIERNF